MPERRREPDDEDLAHLEAQAEELARRLRKVREIIERIKKREKKHKPV
jgi:molecular chaperone GrpE (heat shock protein)